MRSTEAERAAVELTKAALENADSSVFKSPDEVAAFIGVIYEKLLEIGEPQTEHRSVFG